MWSTPGSWGGGTRSQTTTPDGFLHSPPCGPRGSLPAFMRSVLLTFLLPRGTVTLFSFLCHCPPTQHHGLYSKSQGQGSVRGWPNTPKSEPASLGAEGAETSDLPVGGIAPRLPQDPELSPRGLTDHPHFSGHRTKAWSPAFGNTVGKGRVKILTQIPAFQRQIP